MIRIPWYPAAERHNIPPGPADPPIHPRIICLHTMAGWIEGAEARFRDGSGIEAHFGVALDGRVWQWRDSGIQADAQAAGNDYCISIETEDGGHPETRWTPVQFQRLVDLVGWLGVTHSIPMQLVTATSDWGIGYHRQFPSWNPNNHSCPGDIRLAQLRSELLPALQGKGDLTMAEAADILAALTKLREDLTVFGTKGLEPTVEEFAQRQRVMILQLEAIASRVTAIESDVARLAAALIPPAGSVP